MEPNRVMDLEANTGINERHGRVVNTPPSYSGGHGFKSHLEDRLTLLFLVLLSPSRQIPG
jgi:hypothetical protein